MHRATLTTTTTDDRTSAKLIFQNSKKEVFWASFELYLKYPSVTFFDNQNKEMNVSKWSIKRKEKQTKRSRKTNLDKIKGLNHYEKK